MIEYPDDVIFQRSYALAITKPVCRLQPHRETPPFYVIDHFSLFSDLDQLYELLEKAEEPLEETP
jgi:hypothetical protein